MSKQQPIQPACFRLADQLKGEIRARYTPGQRLDPLRKLAEEHHVSTATMSQALMILAYNGWIQPLHGSGFYIRERTVDRHVAVLLELDIGLAGTSRFWSQVAQSVRQKLRQQGISNRLYVGHAGPNPQEDELPCPDLVEDVQRDRIGGVIRVCGPLHEQWAAPLQQQNIPIAGGYSSHASVHLDHETFAREAVQRLVKSGRSRIGALVWAPGSPSEPLRNGVINAFAAEIARQGLSYREEWVRCDLHPAADGAGWEEFREIWLNPNREKPDALVITDDMLLKGAAVAIREMGIRVPEQLHIAAQVGLGTQHQLPFPADVATADPGLVADELLDLYRHSCMRPASFSQSRIIPLSWNAPSPDPSPDASFHISTGNTS